MNKIVKITNTERRMTISDSPFNVGDLITYEAFDGWVVPFKVGKINVGHLLDIPEGVYVEDKKLSFRWVWGIEGCKKVLLVEGDRALMIEHWALVTDEDSKSEEPYATFWKEDATDIEVKLCRQAERSCVMSLTNNTLSAEYMRLTGAKGLYEVRYDELRKKLRWQLVEKINERTENIDEYYKL